MFTDLYEVIKEFLKGIITSRIFLLGVIFSLLFISLVIRLFNLQIVSGEDMLDEYLQKTMATITTQSTRGNIYDRNGNLLAYNELAYSVTVTDTGAYTRSVEKNYMLLDLVHLLKKHGYAINTNFGLITDSSGEVIFSASTETSKKQFLRDIYGRKSVSELDDADGLYPSDITARELLERLKKSYDLDLMEDEAGTPLDLTNEEAVGIIAVRYALNLVAYRRYESVTVASNVDDRTVADVLEHAADLQGVDIEEETIRIYNDSTYFAHIIGYTGTVWEEELEELREMDKNYSASDMVGKAGLEQRMEYELHGTKGSQTMYRDSRGHILEVTESVDPIAGNDLYLTIDRELQIGVYHLIEQQLAGVLVNKIKNKDIVITGNTDSTFMEIPVKTAYFQLINNNVLSYRRFGQTDASAIEHQIYGKFTSRQSQVIETVRNQLISPGAAPYRTLSDELQTYMSYVITFLSSDQEKILITANIDRSDEVYLAYREGTISIREYLMHGISNNWIDTTKLSVDSKYSGADDVYQVLVEHIAESLYEDREFTKFIYKYLIEDNTLTGRELCLALFEQGILLWDDEAVAGLTANGSVYAYNFFMSKIASLEITPAQLALDPCSGFCVITDVNTGEVLAMVSYPSYDNNKFSGRVDAEYFSQLRDDKSLPLFNNANYVRTAPGSTFKPLAAAAGLEEGAFGVNELFTTEGQFTTFGTSPGTAIRCWIYPGNHGTIDIVGALRTSCNHFFNELGYRLSLDGSGNYVDSLGTEKMAKYASYFGLDRASGVELPESAPQVATEQPVYSAMGQSNNSYTCIQLARYATTLANKGTVYDLSILDKMTDVEGNLLVDYEPAVSESLEFKPSTWNAIHRGMREVITDGTPRGIFVNLPVAIAGKTGTAQESTTRANHGLFISFGPVENPEISVTVQIPYGYSSSNAAEIVEKVYQFKYGDLDFATIMGDGASSVSGVQIGE